MSLTENVFTKTGVGKLYAFDAFLRQLPKFHSFYFEEPNLVIFTTEPLSPEELNEIDSAIQNYTDPEVFLSLNSTIPDTVRSLTTNSTSPKVVQTFIYTNTNQQGSGVFNSIKTVLEYSTNDVSQWADFEGSLSVTFEIFCYTRQITISSHTIDITDVANSWKQKALSNETGFAAVYRTFQIEGLRHIVANFDCLWNYILSVSDARVFTTIHAKQMLYYDIM